jgi:hypothetical protein
MDPHHCLKQNVFEVDPVLKLLNDVLKKKKKKKTSS